MKRLLLLACLLLTACVPAVVTVEVTAPAVSDVELPGDVLPVEAQRVIDRATATAGAVATQAAVMTAAEVSARTTSTAAVMLTREALEVVQTQAAITLTVQAGAIAATGTRAAQTQAARQTSPWATATWSAVATQRVVELASVQATATEIAVRAGKSAATGDLLTGLVQVMLVAALLTALAVGSVCVWWANRRQQIRTETYQAMQDEQLERARAETNRVKAAAVQAMIVERETGPYLITASGLVPLLPGGHVVQAQPNRAFEWRWRSACKAAVYTGVALGERQNKTARFGERDLASAEHPYVVNADGSPSSAGYRDIQRLLVRAGVWVAVDRKGTGWARGWTLDRFETEFDQLALPDLPAGEPPEVRIVPRSSALPAAAAGSAAPQWEGVDDDD